MSSLCNWINEKKLRFCIDEPFPLSEQELCSYEINGKILRFIDTANV